MEEQAKKTKKNVSSRLLGKGKGTSPKNSLKKFRGDLPPRRSPGSARSREPSPAPSKSSPVPTKKSIVDGSSKRTEDASPSVGKRGEGASSSAKKGAESSLKKQTASEASGKRVGGESSLKRSGDVPPSSSKKTDTPVTQKKSVGAGDASPAMKKSGGESSLKKSLGGGDGLIKKTGDSLRNSFRSKKTGDTSLKKK